MRASFRCSRDGLLACVLAAACSSGPTPGTEAPEPAASPAAAKSEPAAPAVAQTPWTPVDTDPQPGKGKDFAVEAQQLYRVVACGLGPLPAGFDEDVVEKHCQRLRPILQAYRDNYLSKAGPFFDQVRPKDLPPAVVYPFGGGDLLSALTTFPDALEITTISLEYAGDPARLGQIKSKADLEVGLDLMAKQMSTLLKGDWNWTRNMEETQKGALPGQIASSLAAMVVHNYEPVSLRFFDINRDGTITYLEAADIKAKEGKKPDQLRHWGAPDWSEAYSNMEIRFRKRGGGPVKVFRHVAANLADKYMTTDRDHLTKDPSLLAHLQAKGRVCAMTRAASHLLWEDYFSEIRRYLVANLEWMPSDSTGVPPPFAKEAGLVQEPYGKFQKVFKASDQDAREQYTQAFRDLFASIPERPLGFRYGYPDGNGDGHIVITRRPD